MRASHDLSRVSISFDEPNLVSHAGLVAPAALAQRLGVAALVDARVDLAGARGGANVGTKAMTIIGGLLAGADSIDDMDVMRAGATGDLFEVRAPSTLGTCLRSFSFGDVRALDAVSELFVRAWAAGAGPPPAAQARTNSSLTASRARTSPKLNERRHVPSVDGARTSKRSPVAPARITSMSSMLSAPASSPPMIIIALVPTLAPPRAPARSTRASTSAATPSRCARAAGATSPACDTRFGSSKLMETRLKSCDARIRQMPSRSVRCCSLARHIVPGQRAFDLEGTPPHTQIRRWIRAYVSWVRCTSRAMALSSWGRS